MRKFWFAATAVGCLGGPALAAGAPATEPTGDWMVAEKTAVIRVAPCANAPGNPSAHAATNILCGSIVWTKGPPGTDENNPDPAKRSQSVIGLPILLNMKPTNNPNQWEGEIYNAKDGKVYSGNITLTNENVLRIQGCVLGFLCGGENWDRAKCEEARGGTVGQSKRTAPATPPPSPSVTSCRVAAP